MNKISLSLRYIISIFCLFIFMLNNGFAQSSSQNYKQKSAVVDEAGGKASSLNFNTKSSLGQSSALGKSVSGNFKNYGGFFYQLFTIEVTSNNPPSVTISSPSNNSSFKEGEAITFIGSATDPEDGNLSGSSLVWTSSVDGQIGTGTSFSRSDLSVGTHTITLTATDSQGATGIAQVTITVNASSIIITGSVISSEDQSPVEEAIVEILKDGNIVKSTYSDENGNFVISDLEPSEYVMRASDGFIYNAKTVSLSVNTNVDFTLPADDLEILRNQKLETISELENLKLISNEANASLSYDETLTRNFVNSASVNNIEDIQRILLGEKLLKSIINKKFTFNANGKIDKLFQVRGLYDNTLILANEASKSALQFLLAYSKFASLLIKAVKVTSGKIKSALERAKKEIDRINFLTRLLTLGKVDLSHITVPAEAKLEEQLYLIVESYLMKRFVEKTQPTLEDIILNFAQNPEFPKGTYKEASELSKNALTTGTRKTGLLQVVAEAFREASNLESFIEQTIGIEQDIERNNGNIDSQILQKIINLPEILNVSFDVGKLMISLITSGVPATKNYKLAKEIPRVFDPASFEIMLPNTSFYTGEFLNQKMENEKLQSTSYHSDFVLSDLDSLLNELSQAVDSGDSAAVSVIITQLEFLQNSNFDKLTSTLALISAKFDTASATFSDFDSLYIDLNSKNFKMLISQAILWTKLINFFDDPNASFIQYEVIGTINEVRTRIEEAFSFTGQIEAMTSSIEVPPFLYISSVKLPEEIFSGEVFTLQVKLTNKGEKIANDVKLRLIPDTLVTVISESTINVGNLNGNSTLEFTWQLKAINLDEKNVGEIVVQPISSNASVVSRSILFSVESSATSVEHREQSIPIRFELHQNYPNPFNPETKIEYTVPKTGRVVLKIYNHLGQKVRTLVDQTKPAGKHIVVWDGKDANGIQLASGSYFYQLQIGDFTSVKKMIKLK